MSSSRLRGLEERFGFEILEILNMIYRIEGYGGRGPLRAEHIASFLALDKVEITTLRGAFKSFSNHVVAQIQYLKEQGIVGTEPELHCLLDARESQELIQAFESRQKGRVPLPDLLFYAFQIFQKRIPWRTLSSTDDPLNNALRGVGDLKRGLYVKIAIDPMVFTGILPLDDDSELEGEFLHRVSGLQDEGIIRVRTTKLPIHPLSLFPMNAAVARLGSLNKRDVARRYFGNLGGENENRLEKWYKDYLRYYRSIVSRVPDLDVALGGLMMGKHLVVAVDPSGEQLIVREYVASGPNDEVEVRTETIGPWNPTNNMLENKWLMRETKSYSKDRKSYLRQDHPYLTALNDIERSLRDLRLQRPLIEVAQATDQSLQSWIQSEIDELRLLVQTLSLQDQLSNWLGPVHAYVAYSVSESDGRQDGIIAQRFYASIADHIFIKRLAAKEESANALFEKAFGTPTETGLLVAESISGLVYFLASILGDPYFV
ncbi:MAG: hypothetical protein ABSD99_01245 [Candidatus Bathyarchaeia archaeon]